MTKPIEHKIRQWIDAQITQLKLQRATLIYDNLKDELESETNNGVSIAPAEEAPKYALASRSRKRKEVSEHQPKPKVYARKAIEGESSKREKKSGGFSEILTIEEDPLHEGEEEAEQPKSLPTTFAPAITTTIVATTPPPLTS